MPSLPSTSTCKICGFDESVHLRPCTQASSLSAAAAEPSHTVAAAEEDMASEAPTSPVIGKAKSEKYDGQCHCGKVKFSVKLSPPVYDGPVTSCNCSICTANGYLMVYPLESNVTWHQGKDDLTTYTFGKERIDHSFCSVCGTSVCAMSNDPNFFADNRAINVRTLQGVEIERLKLRKADGRNM